MVDDDGDDDGGAYVQGTVLEVAEEVTVAVEGGRTVACAQEAVFPLQSVVAGWGG